MNVKDFSVSSNFKRDNFVSKLFETCLECWVLMVFVVVFNEVWYRGSCLMRENLVEAVVLGGFFLNICMAVCAVVGVVADSLKSFFEAIRNNASVLYGVLAVIEAVMFYKATYMYFGSLKEVALNKMDPSTPVFWNKTQNVGCYHQSTLIPQSKELDFSL